MKAFDHTPIMGMIQNKIIANIIVFTDMGAAFDNYIITGLKNGGHTGPRYLDNIQSKKCQKFLEVEHFKGLDKQLPMQVDKGLWRVLFLHLLCPRRFLQIGSAIQSVQQQHHG